MEVSEYLVGSPAFKAGGTGDPRPAGSIPVHLRQIIFKRPKDLGRLYRYLDDVTSTWLEPQSGGFFP